MGYLTVSQKAMDEMLARLRREVSDAGYDLMVRNASIAEAVEKAALRQPDGPLNTKWSNTLIAVREADVAYRSMPQFDMRAALVYFPFTQLREAYSPHKPAWIDHPGYRGPVRWVHEVIGDLAHYHEVEVSLHEPADRPTVFVRLISWDQNARWLNGCCEGEVIASTTIEKLGERVEEFRNA